MTKNGRCEKNIDFLTKFDEIRDLWQNVWQNLHFLANKKMTFLVAKSGGDLEKALSYKFNHASL